MTEREGAGHRDYSSVCLTSAACPVAAAASPRTPERRTEKATRAPRRVRTARPDPNPTGRRWLGRINWDANWLRPGAARYGGCGVDAVPAVVHVPHTPGADRRSIANADATDATTRCGTGTRESVFHAVRSWRSIRIRTRGAARVSRARCRTRRTPRRGTGSRASSDALTTLRVADGPRRRGPCRPPQTRPTRACTRSASRLRVRSTTASGPGLQPASLGEWS